MSLLLVVYLHFLGVVALFALLFAQMLLFQPDLPATGQRRLVWLDLAYGGAATLVLASGLLQVFGYSADPDFYWHNPTFHLMGAAFLAAALLSLYPTRCFITRARRLRVGGAPPYSAAECRRILRIQQAELALLLVALWLAVLMARGLRVVEL